MPPIPKLPVDDVDLANLRESGLTLSTIRENGLRTEADSRQVATMLNRTAAGQRSPRSGLVIPYRDLNGEVNCFVRVRPHKPRMSNGKLVKYEQPLRAPLRAYFPVASLPKLRDGASPVYITEGEKKALALSQLDLAAIGIGGVDCWGKDGKLLDDLEEIDWTGREVFIVFDNDEKPKTRKNVRRATKKLTDALKATGAAEVYNVKLPPGRDGRKQGVDDFLVANDSDAFRELIDQMKSSTGEDGADTATMADAAEVVARIEYLIPDWIPLGMVTGIVAEPGIGKSAFVLHEVVRPIVTGSSWFTGADGPGEPGRVLWCDTENGMAITMQRMSDWGIPMDRIILPFKDPLKPIDLSNEQHLKRAESLVKEYGIKAVIVDSLRGSHDGDENNSRVGRVLQGLGGIAERTGCAVIVVHHTRKLSADEEITANSSRGSNAILAMMRSQIGIDRPDRNSKWCRMRVLKENLGIAPQPVGFQVTSKGLGFGPAPEKPRKETQKDEAEEWLRNRMKPGQWYKAADLIEEAMQYGLAKRTVQRAATERLGIKPVPMRKDGKIAEFKWKLP